MIGIALGAGFARGLAHIGVIKILQKENIPLHIVAGSSMGSVIGALYASGMKIQTIERLAQRINRKNWMDLTVPRMGLLSGERLEKLIQSLTRQSRFDDLWLPFAAVAVDLNQGHRVIMQKGSVAKAVRASCAIPGVFNPLSTEDMVLVDGGVLERVPVEVTRNMGADINIAVDVTAYLDNYPLHNIFDVIFKTIDVMSKEITRHRTENSDILITPDLRDLSPTDFSRTEETIRRGEVAAKKALPQIKSLLSKKRRNLWVK